MKKNHLHYDVRRTRIYRDVYRPKPSRFFSTLLSIIIQGQSQVGSVDQYLYRKVK